ncbi:MAG: alanine--tRNA ligase [Dehalococcoidia bacterium]|nr:alanine--tRNA ligase [Dehalococcoidia bacterium]
MTADELREKFLLFFEQRQHRIIPSSSLIPAGDPTLLLTSAGMVQFKPYFTGEAVPPWPRLASCQKCFRTTDIASVGNSKHLTFFEMLGNFSIGDYFKKEAVAWAWEFVMEWLRLPRDKLWITVFTDDDESFEHWRAQGIEAERILRCGEKDNFWGPAGQTGPCGPCSEIHYDFGEESGCGPECSPSCGCGRFLEIWNLVFTQYYQDAEGKRTPLPRKNIDTGMGLERTATVLQGVRSPYETDLFAPIVSRISELTGCVYGSDDKTDRTMRIIAEHGRAVTFLVSDGVVPSNDGRGYVLRRILRRAALFGRTLGLQEPFLAEVAESVIGRMGHVYPELVANRALIRRVLQLEEERFDQTSDRGVEILKGLIDYRIRHSDAIPALIEEAKAGAKLEDAARMLEKHGFAQHNLNAGPFKLIGEQVAAESITDLWCDILPDGDEISPGDLETGFSRLREWPQLISGREAFVLYDTYGFPAELTAELAADSGLSVDLEGFGAEMERQRERARAAHKFLLGDRETGVDYASMSLPPTDFTGYDRTSDHARIISLAVNGHLPAAAQQGQRVEIVLDRTPFYAEMGGQVGDIGELVGARGRVEVTSTIWSGAHFVVHTGEVAEGEINLGEDITAVVDEQRRMSIARNHTATHLLHAALREVLGSHVRQAGSLVAHDRFRFDFSQDAPVLKEELQSIQRIVNDHIRRNLPVRKTEMTYREAVAAGAIALFGEKYGDVVRVVEVGEGESRISFEVCGGTHVDRTGDISFFLILSEGSIGSGMRRIEAVTGSAAESLVEERLSTLERIAGRLQSPITEAESKLEAVLDELDGERKRAGALEHDLIRETAGSLLGQVESVKGIPVLAAALPASNIDALRYAGDFLREKLGSGVIVLGAVWDDRPSFLAMVTPDLVKRGLNAGEIVRAVAREAGGSGGGRPNLGQGGGKDRTKLEPALKLVARLVGEKA